MKRLRWIGALLVVVGILWGWSTQDRPAGSEANHPFTDLETALASGGPRGWELQTRPPRPGPYRLIPGGEMLGRNEGTGLTCRVHDDRGMILEEVRLKAIPGCDQLVVYLEAPGGHRTMAVLRRPG